MRWRTSLILTCVTLVTLTLCAQHASSVRSEPIRLRQITATPQHTLNINPALSGDGSRAAFESTSNSYDATGAVGFRLLQADITDSLSSVRYVASTRAPVPALSQNGSVVAFAAADDPLGSNLDHNSEIFIYDNSGLRQLTFTSPRDSLTRTTTGNFNPSISDDGRFIVFSSTCNITNRNPDFNHEVILYDQAVNAFTQLTDSSDVHGATDAKISGDSSRIAYIQHTTDPNENISSSRHLMLYERLNNLTRAIASDMPNLVMTYGRAMSDDGSRIVFSANTAANSSQVFVFDSRLNLLRQITRLGSRSDDIALHATISGDGTRIVFATRRTVESFSNTDRSVELYVYDFPLAQFTKITDAPANAVAEVVSSVNDEGTLVAFNFPRVLTSAPSNTEFATNSEIFLAALPQHPAPAQDLVVLNAASLEFAPTPVNTVAPESIAIARSRNLSLASAQASPNAPLPTELAGTFVTVANRRAKLLSVSPTQINFIVPDDVSLGAAQVVVTNANGLQITGTANLSHAAPGIFTASNDGQGEAIALDARTLQASPFDLLDGGGNARRVFVFTTGVRGASVVAATLDHQPVEVKSMLPVSGMPGLDQVEILLPRTLTNRGRVPLRITADGQASNSTFLRINDILINEILADPPDETAGDANRDGLRSASDDEFLELVNSSSSDLPLGGYELFVRNTSGADVLRHRFADNTFIPAGTSIVIFGGANATAFNHAHHAFGGAQVVLASSGSLGLPNGGSLITLRDPAGRSVDEFTYGSLGGVSGNDDQSITRLPDIRGNFTLHTVANSERRFSPGTRTDGTPFITTHAISRIILEPAAAILSSGEARQFTPRALDADGAEVPGVIFRWDTSDGGIARVNQDGLVTAVAPGAATITAVARGVRSAPATITVNAPVPSVVRVELTPSSISINRGSTTTFTARAFNREGTELASAIFSFSSANPLIARIEGSSSDLGAVIRGGGLGRTTIRATTSNGAGGTISGEAFIDIEIPLAINEILADVPPDDSSTLAVEGDANRDGVRSGSDDEFIELVNTSVAPVDLSGIRIADSTSNRFTFPANTMLAAGQAAIIFGGGSPPARDPAFGGAIIFTASSLGLNDAGDTVTIKLPLGDVETIIATQTYPSAGIAPAPANESFTRSPDAERNTSLNSFVAHRTAINAAGRPFSPGTRANGTPFNSPSIVRIEVAPANATFETGESRSFTARAFAIADNLEVEVPNTSFIWGADDARNLSTTPQTGATTNVRTSLAGTFEFRARAGGLQGSATLTIKPAVVSIELTPAAATIVEGNSTTFTATARDAAGAVVPGVSFDFSLRNASPHDAATIISSTANTVTLRGNRAGSVNAVARYARPRDGATFEDVTTLTIEEAPRVTRIEVQPAEASILTGGQQQFTARAFDQRGTQLQNVTFVWRSSVERIATINESGLATGIGEGTTQITASAAVVTSNPATLVVRNPPPRIVRVEVTPASSVINRGGSQQFNARAFDSEGSVASGAMFSFTSSDPLTADVNNSGLARGTGFGTVIIRVSTSDNRGGTVAGEVTLMVRIPISINEIFSDVPADNAATSEVEGDANRDGVRSADDDEFIELVNASNEAVDLSGVRIADATNTRFTFPTNTIIPAGRAALVFGGGTPPADASAFGGALVFTSNSLSLNDSGDTVSILLSIGSAEIVIASQSYGTGGSAPAAPRDQSLVRSPDAGSDSTGGAFIPHTSATNAEGRIFSTGTRADGTPFGSPSITRIVVTPATAEFETGETRRFTARALGNLNGVETQIPNISFIWAASAENRLRLRPLTGAAVDATAVERGTIELYARAGGSRGSAVLTIKPIIASIELSPDAAHILEGEETTLRATARDAAGTEIPNLTYNFALRDASPADAASISRATTDTVTVRGLRAGSLRVVASLTRPRDGILLEDSSTLTISHLPPRIALVELTPATSLINRGNTQAFTARAFDENNREVSGKTFTFSSSDVAIATINADGLARGVGVGTATIRAATADNRGGNVTGEASLTVRVSLVINEILADVPPDDTATPDVEGDANRDGVRNSDDDEFVELLNNSSEAVDISGVQLTDASSTRFTFPANTILAAGRAVIIFGGGTLPSDASAFGGALVFTTGTLSLNDGGDTVRLQLPVGNAIVQLAEQIYGANGQPNPAPSDQSLTRSPDAETNSTGGVFVTHKDAASSDGRAFSPGSRKDGTPFGSPIISRIEVMPASASIDVGESQTFVARAFSIVAENTELEVPNVSFIWDATNDATVSPRTGSSTRVTGTRAGTSTVRAHAGGRAGTATLSFNAAVARIEITPETANISTGESVTFTARALDANGNEVSDIAFEFSIRDASPPDAARITARTSNTVTLRGEQAGSLMIFARHVRASDGRTFEDASTLTVTVPAVPVAGQIIINEALVSFASSSNQMRVDFLELYNTTSQTLDISGLIITFRPGGSANTPRSFTLPGAVGNRQTLIQPNGYFVIANGATTFGETQVLDASASNFDLNNTTGGIKIEINSVKLDGLTYQGGSAPPASEFISYGEGSIFTFTSGATNDIIRQPNGADSNDNAADFRRSGTASNVSPRAANPTIP